MNKEEVRSQYRQSLELLRKEAMVFSLINAKAYAFFRKQQRIMIIRADISCFRMSEQSFVCFNRNTEQTILPLACFPYQTSLEEGKMMFLSYDPKKRTFFLEQLGAIWEGPHDFRVWKREATWMNSEFSGLLEKREKQKIISLEHF